MRNVLHVVTLLVALAGAGLARAADVKPPERVELPLLRTSIYVGSVKLATEPFAQDGDEGHYVSTYRASVVPWAFWNEHGDISFSVPKETMERFLDGETVEITGKATNHKGRPRDVTARLQPADAESGKIKVRVSAHDIELVFNATYRLGRAETDVETASTGD